MEHQKYLNELAEVTEDDGFPADAEKLREAARELERLLAIVDKLSKTADNVPIVLGMDVWTDGDNGVRQVCVVGVNRSGCGTVTFHGAVEAICWSLNTYSTRAAYEAGKHSAE